MAGQGENFIYVVPVARLEHIPTHSFCFDAICPCHSDADNIEQVQQDYEVGLLTAEEVDMVIKGKTL